jgi:hypothetical protein
LWHSGVDNDRCPCVGDVDNVGNLQWPPVNGHDTQQFSSIDLRTLTNLSATTVSDMQDMPTVKRTLRLLAASFAGAAAVFVVVFALVGFDEPQSPDMADGAALAAAVFGVVGLLVALRWWSRAGEQTRTPANVQLGFIVRIAIAELGLLIGVMAVFLTGSLTAALIGLGLFLVSLLLLVAALDRVPEV